MKEGYRLLEHPSDMGIEASGKSMKEVFEYAALGLVSIIVEPATIDPLFLDSLRDKEIERISELVKDAAKRWKTENEDR